MSQPKTTSQKPKPPPGEGSAAPRNLSMCRYLPQHAVDVADGDLDLVAAALANGGERGMFGGGRGHRSIVAPPWLEGGVVSAGSARRWRCRGPSSSRQPRRRR